MPVAPSRILLLGTEVTYSAAQPPVATYAITGVTTGISNPIRASDTGRITIYLRSIGVTSGGTILVEEADWGPYEAPYSGTWGQITSQAASGIGTNSQLAIHLQVAAYAYVRVNISATITGGGNILASAVLGAQP